MREIRPIQESEAEEFLALLCRVFELDDSRARAVFFSEPMFDLQRKWALFEQGQISSILTTVPLQFGFGCAIGIAGVGTDSEHQGRGYAGDLLEEVLSASRTQDESAAFLFARATTLYERLGFSEVDQVIRCPLRSDPVAVAGESLTSAEVRARYEEWSCAHPARLRRDPRRWNYWNYTMKLCEAFGPGYLCLEGGVVREAVSPPVIDNWPVSDGVEWLGLKSMATELRVPLTGREEVELKLMARNAPMCPQMFMTDQF